MADFDTDIIIVGGGLIGAICLLAFRNTNYHVTLVDAQPLAERCKVDFDARSLALSMASVRIVQMLNIWTPVQAQATPINSICVSQQGHFGQTRLHAKNEPLGYVLEMQHLNAALQPLLEQQAILAPAEAIAYDMQNQCVTIRTANKEINLKARLVIAADGADSMMRRLCEVKVITKTYPHAALVANIGLLRTHHHVAYERFTTAGPLALLPMTDLRAALVWSLPPTQASQWLTLDDNAFLKQLQLAFGYRLGRFAKIGRRQVFPLRQVIMPQLVKGNVVFIGNAAHTLHPVAGQGFNLGLRDVAMLVQCIQQQGVSQTALNCFQQNRRDDHRAIQWLTDGLVELFTSRIPGAAFARSCGLTMLDTLPGFKKELIHYAQGYGGLSPDLVCGTPIRDAT